MEYSLNDLDKGIYYFLTLNSDRKFSLSEVRDGLISEKIIPALDLCFNMDKFKETCYTLPNKFNNVSFDGYYLSFSKKNKLTEIEDILNDPSKYAQVRFDTPYYNDLSILHVLCDSGRSDLLDKIHESKYNVNLYVRDSQNRTPFDLIKNDDVNTLRSVSRMLYDQNLSTQNYLINELKNSNNLLKSVNNKLSQQLSDIKEEYSMKFNLLIGATTSVIVSYVGYHLYTSLF